ncbi:MAG: hypothetical protein Q3998_00940 [Porphyromonas sp.]|nr:hypothetical protein [Porphyromonas sp.]
MGAFIMIVTLLGLIGFFAKQVGKTKEDEGYEDSEGQVFSFRSLFEQKSARSLFEQLSQLEEKKAHSDALPEYKEKQEGREDVLDTVPVYSKGKKYQFRAEAEGKTFNFEQLTKSKEKTSRDISETQSKQEDYLPDSIEEWRRAIILSEVLKRKF